MKVTYLGHSGFLAVTNKAVYLFDYIRGELPKLPELPFYVFASHAHGDHFSPLIFDLPKAPDKYFLGHDLKKKLKHRPSYIPEEAFDRIVFADPELILEEPGCRITVLRSTDSGGAFVVDDEGGECIYHAGDLNYWYWPGEPLSWLNNQKASYKREIDKLSGKRIDAAFVPLDPRLEEEGYALGMEYFIDKTDARHVFPMHFWEDYRIIQHYKETHENSDCVELIEREGQEYEI